MKHLGPKKLPSRNYIPGFRTGCGDKWGEIADWHVISSVGGESVINLIVMIIQLRVHLNLPNWYLKVLISWCLSYHNKADYKRKIMHIVKYLFAMEIYKSVIFVGIHKKTWNINFMINMNVRIFVVCMCKLVCVWVCMHLSYINAYICT